MKKSILLAVLFTAVTALLLHACSGDNNSIHVGDTVTSFTGTDLSGKTFSLKSYKGRPVVIRFFLTDCEYCKADTPIFNRFYDKYRDKGLVMVYINNNGLNKAEVQAFTRQLNITFPVIYDSAGTIAKQYNIKLQPLTLILSPEHKLLGALLGGVSEPELHELLSPYLQ